jgi:hypothetical protein
MQFLKSRAKRKTYHAGRGTAKTNTIGKIVGQIFNRLPRSRWALTGATYIQLDLVVLSEIRESLEQMGILEYNVKTMPYGEYVVCVKPPDDWNKPFKKVGRLGYQYAITHISGAMLQMVSQDRSETSRGLNLDGAITDERATIKTDFLNKIIYPTVRANKDKFFANDPLHLGKYEFSSAAWTQEGMSMYEMESKYESMMSIRKKFSQTELKNTPPEYMWLESTCLDNPLTGQSYWDNLKAELDPLTFDVEVANLRLTKLPNGFYHAFLTSKHIYTPKDCYEYDDEKGLHLYLPNDYRKDKPLELTLDFNAAIFWNLVCQEVGREFRVINSKFVKPSQSIADKSILHQGAEWFCETYKDHPTKEVYIFGDPGGNSRSANTSSVNLPFFDEYAAILIAKGWKVFRRELQSYPSHRDKYRLGNYLLEESSERTPRLRINQAAGNNKAVIIAIQSTAVKQSTESFEKDKKSERKLVNREYATDPTDALDYIWWQKFRKLLPGRPVQKNRIVTI